MTPRKKTPPSGNVRVRFAPSPTGFLHIGGLRTALYNYLFARRHDGVFLLRIEDTDRARTVEGGVENILRTLAWAGLEWDEGPLLEIANDTLQIPKLTEKGDFGPYTQSHRLSLYQTHAQELLKKGSAYYCFCTAERLDALRAKQTEQKKPTMYDGLCRSLSSEEVAARLKRNDPHVIRLRIPDGGVTSFDDAIRGRVDFDNTLIDEQVLVKSDGYPTYHLANVVDDHSMNITHVIRGEEWLSSTPKHILLYRAFGWDPPVFAHLPLLLNHDRSKLSKRQGDVAAEDYRKKGYLPEALMNFVALLGWNPSAEQEIYTLRELAERFDLRSVNKAPAVVNFEKLDWLNGHYLRQMTDTELVDFCLPYMEAAGLVRAEETTLVLVESGERVSREWLASVIAVEKNRLKRADEITELARFFLIQQPVYDPTILIWKKATPESARNALDRVQKFLALLDEKHWGAAALEEHVKSFIAQEGISTGEALWPLRVALSGREASPSPFEIAAILGKEKTLARIAYALQQLAKI